MSKQPEKKTFVYSGGEIEVIPARAAAVHFPDDTHIVILDGGGEFLLIAPLTRAGQAANDESDEEAAKAWQAFSEAFAARQDGEEGIFQAEAGVVEALRAATIIART